MSTAMRARDYIREKIRLYPRLEEDIREAYSEFLEEIRCGSSVEQEYGFLVEDIDKLVNEKGNE